VRDNVTTNYRAPILFLLLLLISCGQSQESNLIEQEAGRGPGIWQPRAGAEVIQILASSSNERTSQAYLYAKGSGTITVSACAPGFGCRESSRKEDLAKMIELINRAMEGAKYVDRQAKANCAQDYHVSVAANGGKFEIYSASCRPQEGVLLTRELVNSSAKELVAWAKAQPRSLD